MGDIYVNSWDELQTAINEAEEDDVIVLTADLDGSGKNQLTVNNKVVTIELNGHVIDRKRTSHVRSGQVFGVLDGSYLTISDAAGTGVITGGYGEQGGGIYIESDSTVKIAGGSVQGNTADSSDGGNGGGIYNKGTLIMDGGSISFNKAKNAGGGIYCTASSTIMLDNALITGNYTVEGSGGGLHINLKDNQSSIENSFITNNRSGGKHGGGIRMDANQKALAVRDTLIEGNTADEEGGGIKLTDGTLRLYGGSVSHNKAEAGGGICTEKGSALLADYTDICHNTATKYGGGGIDGRDIVVLTNSKVNKNDTVSSGGGICFNAKDVTLTLSNTNVKSNTVGYNKDETAGDGGGIMVSNGSLKITGGTFYKNQVKNGCGSAIYFDGGELNTYHTKFKANFLHKSEGNGTIYLQGGEARIHGGTFTNNFAKNYGGGVYVTKNTKLYVEEDTYSSSAGVVTEPVTFNKNGADQYGGSIYLEDNGSLYLRSVKIIDDMCPHSAIYSDEDFYIHGKVIIENPKGCGLYMESDEDKVHIDGKLDESTRINVQLEYKIGSFTEGFAKYHDGEAPEKYFSAQEGYSIGLDGDNEVRVRSTDWLKLQQEINAASAQGTITLTKDYTADSSDSALVIPAGKHITLDLHGYKLDGGKAIRGGTVIEVSWNAELTIIDSYVLPAGVEQKDAENYEGMITGCTQSAIVNKGAITLKGGRINGNKGKKGAAINNLSVLTIEGGRIKSNTATEDGAGIDNSGTLYLFGGEIKNNTSAMSGGGVFCAEDSRLYVKGSPYVKDNNGAAGKNIVLSRGAYIQLIGELDSGARLDVTQANPDYENPQAITKGYASHGRPQSVFTYNENDNITLTEKNGELYVPFTLADVDVWVSSWSELQSAVNNSANQGKIIGLKNDLKPSGQERIEVENGRVVTIELAGHTMNRGFSSKKSQGNVFKVADSNTHLTIRDTFGTGVIRGGYAKGDGGGFYVVDHAKLTIESGAIYGNGASSDGGGIYVDDAELIMTGGAVTKNYADDNGAGIFTCDSAKITLTNAEITFNTSKNAGGGLNIHLKQDAIFTGCTVSHNKSEDKDGGGIVMHASDRKLTLDDCKVDNNTADDEGGGISIDDGYVDVSGGQINGNTADDGGGVYISGGETLVLRDDAKVGNNRTTGQSGGGITCHGILRVNGAKISLNESAKYGGGIFYKNDDEITLIDADISCNTSANDGGGLYIKKGDVTMDGGRIAGNLSIDGGVYVTDDTTFTANGTQISENITTEADGGGIVNKGTTTLENVTIEKNVANYNGGGIWSSGTLKLTDCTVRENKAKTHYGGGIQHAEGDVYLKGSTTIKDNQAIYGGGVYVEEDADNFYVENKPVITDNSGNVYLFKNQRITLNGTLESGARIGVSTFSDTGVFTRYFKWKTGSTQPSDFFFSDCGYEVYPSGDEAALRWTAEEDPNAFIDRNNNIADSGTVMGRNWMSAISGERTVNEFNLIRAHDAVMNNANANTLSTIVTTGLTIGGASFIATMMTTHMLIASLTIGFALPAWLFFIDGLAITTFVLAFVYKGITEKQAKTQYHYVDELMNMGVRVFDLRINNKNWEEIDKGDHDDNVNLWHCHGESNLGGAVYGCDQDDSVLSVNDTLNYAKEFLRKNPTEVLYFEYSLETQDNAKYDALIAARLKKILKEFSYEINPSTGKPYLYMEDGVFGKEYTYWPKLKDARGQILYTYDNWTDESARLGGYKNWDMDQLYPNYTRTIGGNGVVKIPVERIQQTEDAVNEHPLPNILTDAMVHRKINSGLYVNTTDNPEAILNWFSGKQAWFTETPLELEEKILYGQGTYVDVRDTTVFHELHEAFGTEDWYDPEYEPGYEGLLRESGFIKQQGCYYGIFSFDGVTEKEAKICWGSNFYDDLEYRTVTVKSGIPGDDTVKTYRVLKGTPITIPNCIYEKPSGSNSYFQSWKATTGASGSWEPSYCLQDEDYFGSDYTGRNNREWLMSQSYEEPIDPSTQIPQNSERSVMPGEVITIMDDTEFTAVWGAEVKTGVSVVWEDGNNADSLRPDTLNLTYQNPNPDGAQTATAEADGQWTTMISGCTDINTLAVNWEQVHVSADNPRGDSENGYSYTVTGDINNGITVTMYHRPQATITAAGTVSWDDNDNTRDVRPDSVTLYLIQNGDEDNPCQTVTVTEAEGWAYNFGDFPEYTETEENGVISYQRNVYSVTEAPFNYYSAFYDDFDITNVYVDPVVENITVQINWKDGYNAYGERPETVTLHLWDGETEIDQQQVAVDPDEAKTLAVFDVEKYELNHLGKEFDYRVTQDDIPKYTAEWEEMEKRTVVVDNKYDYSGKYFTGHSLTLNGDIGVNFFVNVPDETVNSGNVKIDFEWTVEGKQKTHFVTLNADDKTENGYKASCPVAVAEMTYDVNAKLFIDGTEVERDKYSVVKYANVIMSDKDFYNNYIEKMTVELGGSEKAKEKYSDLVDLAMTMLDYGAKAQIAFDRDTANLANGGVDMYKDAVTSDMIESKASDMASGLDGYGLKYVGTTVVYLSKTSMRHYYTITDETLFNEIKDDITFNGEKVNYTVKNGQIYFELKNISARDFNTQYVIKIDENEYHYSVLDYVKACLDSTKVTDKTKELVAATYRYNQAAIAYFG